MSSSLKWTVSIVALAAAATVGLAAMSAPAQANESLGCTERLVAAESATISDWGPSVTINGAVTIGIGDPERTVNDIERNAAYWGDCVT